MNENTSLHDFGFRIPLSNKWNQSSLEKRQDPSLGQEKQMHRKHFLVPESKECSKNDRGVLKGCRSQLEGAKTGTTYIFDIWATIHMIVIDYTAIDETQHSN